jgi:hypothetical protein
MKKLIFLLPLILLLSCNTKPQMEEVARVVPVIKNGNLAFVNQSANKYDFVLVSQFYNDSKQIYVSQKAFKQNDNIDTKIKADTLKDFILLQIEKNSRTYNVPVFRLNNQMQYDTFTLEQAVALIKQNK